MKLFSDWAAASATDWPRAVSAMPATGDVSIVMVACRASSTEPPNDVAAAEKFFGIVTTAAYRPDASPARACVSSASTQLKFCSRSESTRAADSCRPSGTCWPLSVTISSLLTTAAWTRRRFSSNPHVPARKAPATSSGTSTRASRPRQSRRRPLKVATFIWFPLRGLRFQDRTPLAAVPRGPGRARGAG